MEELESMKSRSICGRDRIREVLVYHVVELDPTNFQLMWERCNPQSLALSCGKARSLNNLSHVIELESMK